MHNPFEKYWPYIIAFVVFVLFGLADATADIQKQAIEYRDQDTRLTGYIFWDDAAKDKRPGVMVVHEWWGLNDYALKRARMLAELGYVAFAADMYGSQKVTTHPKQAGEWSARVTSDVENWQRRAQLGLDILKSNKQTNPTKLAAIGYCFGGNTVMQMAFSGAELKGVVSFHGSLPVAGPEIKDKIKAKILVAHGYLDNFIPQEKVVAFQSALEKAGAEWQFVSFGNTRHSFTNPGADGFGIDNLKYNKLADQRSWNMMRYFFDEIFDQ